MKKYTQEEIAYILKLHKEWLNGSPLGKKADLSFANLSGADLSFANLAGANLAGADLSEANLAGANLAGADLFEANLPMADLSKASLAGATLFGTNLAYIKGKSVLTFYSSHHFASACDGYIKIGCKLMTIEDWLKSYKEIGKENQYSEEEIEAYGGFIKLVNKYFTEETTK